MDYYRSLSASALDPDFPTVFELLSARQLDGLIHPSLRFLLVHYAQRNPQYLLRVANRFDELFLVLFGAVEYLHLKNWNASFTERFYGLKRTNILTLAALKTRTATPNLLEKERRLTRRQVWLSLAGLVLVPYLREKCQARFEKLKGRYAFRSLDEDRPEPGAPITKKLQFYADVAVLRLYPWYVLGEALTGVGFAASYLFHKTTASSLTDWLLGFKYARLAEYDYRLNEPQTAVRHWAQHLEPKQLARHGLAALNYTLPSALFLLKFLEWWNSSEFVKKLHQVAPLLEPPKLSRSHNLKGCPICGRTSPETPTVLESGVVFCYKCIFDYLQNGDKDKTPVCPVTGKPLLLTTYNKEVGDWQVGGLRRLMI